MALHMARHNKQYWLGNTLAVLAAVAVWIWAVPVVFGTLESYKASAGQPVEGQEWSQDGTLVVFEDHGGSVVRRIGQWKRMERDGVDIAVLGLCASACTLAIANPRTCTAPGALWMFHRAYADEGNAMAFWGLRGALGWSIENAIQGFYPDGFSAWQSAIPEGQDVWVVGADLIEAGWVAPCSNMVADPEQEAKVRALAAEWNLGGPVQGAELAALLTLPRNTDG
jgi:hypothetical protein